MTSNAVDSALALPADQVGKAILSIEEDQWFDRKSSRINPKDLAVPMVALANAEGGVIVVGASKGKVDGIRDYAHKLNDFRQVSINFTNPAVRARFDQVACVNDAGVTDTLLVIRIDPSERVHEIQNGDCYLRVGDESRKLNFTQQQELVFDKGQSVFDGYPVRETVGIADLDAQLLDNYRSSMGLKRNNYELLMARSLLTPKRELTNAGYLLFAPRPQDIFPQAHIRVIRFLTVERGTGARLGIEEGSDVRIEGPIPPAIQEAAQVIEELLPQRRSLAGSGRFEPRPVVPRDAWLEGLVNAVIHRSYSLSGDHIRVEVYPNRIEIESPGRFPGLADPSTPLEISRFARNPRIARVCSDLRIGQELGEGIKRMFEEMRAVGLTDPIYKQSQGSVRLILQGIPRLSPRLMATLPKRSQEVLDVLRRAGTGLSTGDIARALALSRPATITRLKALEGERLVLWTGKSAQDPRALWTLNDD